MGDLVNLRRARKARERQRREQEAGENRVLSGMSKAERLRIESERGKAERDLEGKRLVPPDEQ